MAKNLQSKLKPSDKVSIFDINPESMKGLETEMKAASTGAQVELAASAFNASKDAVGQATHCICRCLTDTSRTQSSLCSQSLSTSRAYMNPSSLHLSPKRTAFLSTVQPLTLQHLARSPRLCLLLGKAHSLMHPCLEVL